MSYRLTEIAVDLILNHIQTNIQTELLEVSTERGDSVVNLEVPQRYLIFETEKNYRKPAIFCIVTHTDFELDEGANHINAMHDMHVSCVVEDRTEPLLVRKAWRYQVALVRLLHLNELETVDKRVKIIPKVTGISYSPVYTEDTGEKGVFCKEVLIELNTEHYEKL